jgi:uncharacterized iron-regulated protein
MILFIALPLFLIGGGCVANRACLNVESPYRDPSSFKKGEILHLATGKIISESELLDFLSRFPIVYVGETHDNVEDHAVELAILKGMCKRVPGEVALGLEMLQRTYQADVDSYLHGDMEEKEFLKVWQQNWGDTFPYYKEILCYARDNYIPVLALNAESALRKAVREKGLDNLDPEMAKRLPEMDLEDPYYGAFIKAIFKGHKKGPRHEEVFSSIQVLWDETMAETAAQYLKSLEGRGRHLVIFAGGDHVRYGFGIPRRLFRRIPVPYAVVIPFAVEVPERMEDRLMHVELPVLPMRPADFYWAVGYRDLDTQ